MAILVLEKPMAITFILKEDGKTFLTIQSLTGMSTKRKKEKFKYKVVSIESERGWGQNIISEEKYKRLYHASNRVHKINSRNTSSTVPDYYIFAKLESL